MGYNLDMVKILKCKRCGYEWPQRFDRLPKKCAKCRTPLWNIPRRKDKVTEWIKIHTVYVMVNRPQHI